MAGPRTYTTATRAALATLSQGRCYFPLCSERILKFIEGEPVIHYEIAHICDASHGNRYVADMSDDERRAFTNLILLCKPHHEWVDTRHPERFPSETLKEWKSDREGNMIEQLSKIGHVTEHDLAQLVTQSVSELQARITEELQRVEEASVKRVEAVLSDVSFASLQDAFSAADELSLLSPLGVRARMPNTDLYLRIRRVDSQLEVVLDTDSEASIFAETWKQAESFFAVVSRLAEQVRPSDHWPGAERWQLDAAVRAMVDVITAGLMLKSRGRSINHVVQLVGSRWLLTDWYARDIVRDYGVSYARLDKMDWAKLLREKTWTDPEAVDEMLHEAAFLRDLTSGVGPG